MVSTARLREGSRAELQELSHRWGWMLALGIVLTLIGLLALSASVVATLATVVFIGAMILIGSLTDVVLAFTARGWRGFLLHMMVGVLGVVVGIMMIARPAPAAGVITMLVALLLLVGGTARIIYSAAERFPMWGWSLASGIAAVILGIMVFSNFPVSALWFLGVVVGVELIFHGITWISLSLSIHSASSALHHPRTPTPSAV